MSLSDKLKAYDLFFKELQQKIKEIFIKYFSNQKNNLIGDVSELGDRFSYSMTRAYKQLKKERDILTGCFHAHRTRLNSLINYGKIGTKEVLPALVQCVHETLCHLMTTVQKSKVKPKDVKINRFFSEEPEITYQVSVWNRDQQKWYVAWMLQGPYENENIESLRTEIYLSEFE